MASLVRRSAIMLAGFVIVGGASLVGATTATAQIVESGHSVTTRTADSAELLRACSAWKVDRKTGAGWCEGGKWWRVGVKCTDKKHYYSPWPRDTGTMYAKCGKGTVTHVWVDN